MILRCFSGGAPGPHQIQGIGAGFVPMFWTPISMTKSYGVKNEDAFRSGREISKVEGSANRHLFAGATVWAATRTGQAAGKTPAKSL